MAKFAYNNSFHPALGCSPFYALQGADLAIQQWLVKEMDANIPATKEWAEAIATMRADVEVQWVHARRTQAIYANWKTKPQVFNIGDMVWLSSHNLKNTVAEQEAQLQVHGPLQGQRQGWDTGVPPRAPTHDKSTLSLPCFPTRAMQG